MWYSARLMFESDRADLDGPRLQEVSIRLIEAENEAEAMSKAVALGKREQHEYRNEAGEIVHWRFIEVLEIQDLCEAEVYDGMEVYSRMGWEEKRRQEPL